MGRVCQAEGRAVPGLGNERVPSLGSSRRCAVAGKLNGGRRSGDSWGQRGEREPYMPAQGLGFDSIAIGGWS